MRHAQLTLNAGPRSAPAEPQLRSTLRARLSHKSPIGSAVLSPFAPLALMLALVPLCSAFAPGLSVAPRAPRTAVHRAPVPEASLGIDLKGKVAFVAGVADSAGYGWAIVKALSEAGATVAVGTWPPVLAIFEKSLKSGKLDDDLILSDGSKMAVPKIYPLDAVFDEPGDVPDDVKNNKRYAGLDGYTISEVAAKVQADYGKVDVLVHSLANGPEVKRPLMQVSRNGYLAAASASSYSMVSLAQKFTPFMNKGGSILSLSFVAAERVVPGYGGGMSSAKAQLESDTRVLAFELGRAYGVRINSISAGALKSRAASAIGGARGEKTYIEYCIDYAEANSPLVRDLTADDVGATAAFLSSPLAAGITGTIVYVDNGLQAMAAGIDAKSFDGYQFSYPFEMPGCPPAPVPE